jgi:N-methylhydantoinase A
MLVGVDIGGTFTDLVLSQDGRLEIHKLPSTPQNPAGAMLDGLQAITGNRLQRLTQVAHGSTVATNAILERKGARTALITTAGFRDVLFIARQNRPELYALQPTLPPPLIPRELCYEVPERLSFDGEILTPLDMSALDAVLDEIVIQGIESVAVCLLYSYVNPVHEQAVRARIVEQGRLAEWQVALSSEVLPEFREYERASTVALEAYVRPIMGRYVAQLEAELPSQVHLRMMKSDGGVIGTGRVRRQAVQTALSGPAAGVIGAYHLARLAGFDNIITLDMGGTSTDVAVCPGEPVRRPQSEIDGLPLRVRLLDIETVGAGGGSIARVDAGGALHVGPQSAGADPGPVIYGRGGKQITVSDANALLGRLDPAHFLGGRMRLDLKRAGRAMGKLAQEMGFDPQAAARGVIDVANINIDRALRRVTVARGHDPRDFVLMAFGGAGGLHACAIAEGLEIPCVLVPRYPGVLCAFGLLVADVVLDYARSLLSPVADGISARIGELLDELIARAQDELDAEGIPGDQRHFIPSLDMRYRGQAYELNIATDKFDDLERAFHDVHHQTYGHSLPGREVEIVNLRLQAVGAVEHPAITPEDESQEEFSGARYAVPGEALLGEKRGPNNEVLSLYDRERLLPGARFHGPALVFQLDSTTYIAPGWLARIDNYLNIILERE